MSRLTTRLFLGFTLILAIAASYFAIRAVTKGEGEAWATLAAALAVVTSMVSAWGAQRVVELEEDKLLPFPYPHFDVTSRYGLILLRVTNYGGSTAHHIKLMWDKPLLNSKGVAVQFGEESGTIPVLMPGQHVSKIVDGHIDFFSGAHQHTYEGLIEYRDSRGSKRAQRFMIDAQAYKGTPVYDEESLKTHYELQKLPAHLQELSAQVKKIAEELAVERKQA